MTVHVTDLVSGSSVNSAVPLPEVCTGGTCSAPVSGTLIDIGAAKATPAQIAELSLDGWLAGQHTIWPDRFAELVRDTVGEPFRALLDEPRQVMTAIRAAFHEPGN